MIAGRTVNTENRFRQTASDRLPEKFLQKIHLSGKESRSLCRI